MQSTKLVNRILLCSVVFSVSLTLELLLSKNFTKALLTGMITIPASYVGAVIVDKQRIRKEKLLRGSIQHQIQVLDEEKVQLHQSMCETKIIQQEAEASVNSLQTERSHLINRISELHYQRNELQQSINYLQQQQQQQETLFVHGQNQLQELEIKEEELNRLISTKTTQISPTENRLNRLKDELEQLQSQINEQTHKQEKINQELAILQDDKQNLEGEKYDLQTQINVLKQRQEVLKQNLSFCKQEQQQMELNLTHGQSAFDRLLSQIAEQHKQKKQVHQDLANLENQKQQLELDIENLQVESQKLPTKNKQQKNNKISDFIPLEWLEWLEFFQQLSDEEKKILKAILARDEGVLKQIADQKITMPEVLIDSLSNQAIKIMGDTPFVKSSDSMIPEFYAEYLSVFTEPIIVNFQDLIQ